MGHIGRNPIRSLRAASCIGEELPVAWVIDGFHADNNLHQLGIVLANVP